jgi:hypothetical protein
MKRMYFIIFLILGMNTNNKPGCRIILNMTTMTRNCEGNPA